MADVVYLSWHHRNPTIVVYDDGIEVHVPRGESLGPDEALLAEAEKLRGEPEEKRLLAERKFDVVTRDGARTAVLRAVDAKGEARG